MKRTIISVIALLLYSSCASPQITSLLPEIKSFLSQHTEYGSATIIEDMPNWANGKRQRVKFDNGRTLLFYTKDGNVVTIYEDQPGSGRVKIWGEDESYEPPGVIERDAEDSLPSYKILLSLNLPNGKGRYGDILIPTLSRKTPVETRESIARKIAKAEHLTSLRLYSTEEAYKANISESYSKAHPNALRQGFMGSLEGGDFMAGEILYP